MSRQPEIASVRARRACRSPASDVGYPLTLPYPVFRELIGPRCRAGPRSLTSSASHTRSSRCPSPEGIGKTRLGLCGPHTPSCRYLPMGLGLSTGATVPMPSIVTGRLRLLLWGSRLSVGHGKSPLSVSNALLSKHLDAGAFAQLRACWSRRRQRMPRRWLSRQTRHARDLGGFRAAGAASRSGWRAIGLPGAAACCAG